MERFGAEGIGEMDAERRAAEGEMDDLAEGGVGEVFRGERVVGFGDLLGASPGGDPISW